MADAEWRRFNVERGGGGGKGAYDGKAVLGT